MTPRRPTAFTKRFLVNFKGINGRKKVNAIVQPCGTDIIRFKNFEFLTPKKGLRGVNDTAETDYSYFQTEYLGEYEFICEVTSA